MSNQQDQLIPTQPSSIDENHPNSKIDQNDNQEPQLISQLEEQNKKTSFQLESPFPILSKYKDIYIPTIYTLNLKEMNDAPWKKNNVNLSDYFNYGYNEEYWIEHTEEIKSKLDDFNTLIKENKYILPSVNDELNYLFSFPSDYGGLGDVFNDQNYENVNFFENKTNVHKLAPSIRLHNQQAYVNLEIGNQNINNNINITNPFPFNIPSSINTNVVNDRNDNSFFNPSMVNPIFPNYFFGFNNYNLKYIYFLFFLILGKMIIKKKKRIKKIKEIKKEEMIVQKVMKVEEVEEDINIIIIGKKVEIVEKIKKGNIFLCNFFIGWEQSK